MGGCRTPRRWWWDDRGSHRAGEGAGRVRAGIEGVGPRAARGLCLDVRHQRDLRELRGRMEEGLQNVTRGASAMREDVSNETI